MMEEDQDVSEEFALAEIVRLQQEAELAAPPPEELIQYYLTDLERQFISPVGADGRNRLFDRLLTKFAGLEDKESLLRSLEDVLGFINDEGLAEQILRIQSDSTIRIQSDSTIESASSLLTDPEEEP